MSDESTTVSLSPGDAALLFREDGVDLFIPGLADDARISDYIQEAVAVGLLLRSDDPRFVALRAQLHTLFAQSCVEAASG